MAVAIKELELHTMFLLHILLKQQILLPHKYAVYVYLTLHVLREVIANAN